MVSSSEHAGQSRTMLLVEDNPAEARLVEEVRDDMGIADPLYTVSTVPEALDFVNQRGEYADAPRPDLILLDWHLSSADGAAVLEELNGDLHLSIIPVIVAAGSMSDAEIREAYELNANACIRKPVGPDELEETLRSVRNFWLSAVMFPDGNGQ